MELGAVVLIRWECGVANYLIGGLGVTKIEQLAGKHAPLAPPLVGILRRHGIAGRCAYAPGGFGNPVIAKEPMKTAERIAQVLAYRAGNLVEQYASITSVRHSPGARFDDGGIGTAQARRRAHCRCEILAPNAAVHSRDMVGASYESVKSRKPLSFKLGRQLLGSPGLPDLAFRSAAVALAEQHASQSQPASGAGRLPVQEEATHRDGVTPLLPQCSFRAPAQETEGRPGGIVADEGYIAIEIRPTVLRA